MLEVGPGVGVHAIPVARAVAPDGALDVIDIQPAMIATLRTRARAASVRNVFAICGDATTLPYGDATFDAAVLITVLGEIPEPDAALRELKRVLKPDGRLVIGETLVDPDFVSLRVLRSRLDGVGFQLDDRSGWSASYLARFRPGPTSHRSSAATA